MEVEGFESLPLEVEGEVFLRCLSKASLIRFRSIAPVRRSDLDDPPLPIMPPLRSLYIIWY